MTYAAISTKLLWYAKHSPVVVVVGASMGNRNTIDMNVAH